MALQSMVALATISVQANTAQIVFSGIPQNYRDLILVSRMVSNGGDGLVGYQFNGDTSTSYANIGAYGEAPSTAGSFYDTRAYIVGSITSVGTTAPTMLRLQVIDSNQSTKTKTVIVRNDRPDGDTSMLAGRWGGTAAITSIRMYFTGTGQFAPGSTFSLYGRIA